MRQPAEFARLSGRRHAPVDQLLIALAAEFGPVDRQFAQERLDDLGRRLFGMAALDAEPAARRLIAVLAGEAGLVPGPAEPAAFLLDRVLASGRGHPALLAAVYLEAARRAGTGLVLVSGGDDWYVGFEQPDDLVLVASVPFATPARVTGPLRRCCGHELAHSVLGELAPCYDALGHKGQAAHARRLRRLLPIGDRLGPELAEEEGG